MVNRKKAPPKYIDTEIPLIAPRRVRLDNDLPVYFLEGGNQDIIKVELLFFAGSFYQLKPLTAFITARLLRSGTGTKSREEINELLDFYSAHIQTEAQKDIASVSMFVLNKHLEPALRLFCEMVKFSAFPEDEMRVFLKNQQQLHNINQQKVQHLARNYFQEMIYGESHPYGYRVKATDFDHIDREDVVGFHSDFYAPGNAFCVVSGRIPGEIEKLLAEELGNWRSGNCDTLKPPVYSMLSSGSRKMHLEKPGALQSAIRIGKQLLNCTHPAYHRLKITNALLGGFFGSRLMQNIRQDKGYTYGINSSLVSLMRSGYFFITTQVGKEVCGAALDEIYGELKRLRSTPAAREELDILKNYLAGNHLRSFDGPFMQAERFKELLVFGLDTSHHEEYLRELKNITADDIMETAGLYLREEDMMEVVVG